MYTYHATVFRIVDGDTIEMEIDLGFRIILRSNVRMANINAPELSTPEGPAARLFLAQYVPVKTQGVLTSHSLDKYGRVLGDFLPDGSQQTVSQVMVSSGHAVPYMVKP